MPRYKSSQKIKTIINKTQMTRNAFMLKCLLLAVIFSSVQSSIISTSEGTVGNQYTPVAEGNVGNYYKPLEDYKNDEDAMLALNYLYSLYPIVKNLTLLGVQRAFYFPEYLNFRFTFKTTIPQFPNYEYIMSRNGKIKKTNGFVSSGYVGTPKVQLIQKFKNRVKDEISAIKRNQAIEIAKKAVSGKIQTGSVTILSTSYPYYYIQFKPTNQPEMRKVQQVFLSYSFISSTFEVLKTSEFYDFTYQPPIVINKIAVPVVPVVPKETTVKGANKGVTVTKGSK